MFDERKKPPSMLINEKTLARHIIGANLA